MGAFSALLSGPGRSGLASLLRLALLLWGISALRPWRVRLAVGLARLSTRCTRLTCIMLRVLVLLGQLLPFPPLLPLLPLLPCV